MINTSMLKKNTGFTLIELVIVITIIGILAIIGMPQIEKFNSMNMVRRAANDLLQNMRLARTMAIKENREYLITFNEAGNNTYVIGFDGNGNNSLLDGADGYDGGAVRTVNLQTEYGNAVNFGTFVNGGPDEPDACPACVDITGETVNFGAALNPVRHVFNPDGSVDFTGSVFIMHNSRGVTYLLRVSYQSGKFDLLKWDGEADNTNPDVVND